MRALIIENNQAYRDLVRHTLAEQGFSYDSSDNIESARICVDSGNYDIICVAQQLKDGPGEEFVAYCNQQLILQDTPILFLTGDQNLKAEKLGVRVDGVIHELNENQIEDQLVHFIDQHLDPLFIEGRILFVEDDARIAAEILGQLQETGYRVTHFTSVAAACEGFAAVTVYGSHAGAYDLAITGLDFDGAEKGEDLVKHIRNYEDGRGFIPIMAVTSDNSDQRRIALYHLGVNDFLSNPILHEELMVRISNLITNKRLLDKVHDIRRELFALATIDNLTGCHNRHSLMEFSDKFVASARRHEYPISLLVIDLDHFKAVNDHHGHAVGDIVLEETGSLLNRCFREGDLVSRYGGEEFVVLMTHCGARDARHKAEEVRLSIERLQPKGLDITASIGVTSREPGAEGDFEAMFHAGDKGVYAAKEAGRNRVVCIPIDPASGFDLPVSSTRVMPKGG